MKLFEIFNVLEEIERTMSVIYERLTGRFASDRTATTFFTKMQDDEISHLNKVKFVRNLVTKSKEAASREKADIDPEELTQALSKLKTVSDSCSEMPIEKSLEAIIEFEEFVCRKHHAFAEKLVSPEMIKFVRSLGINDEKHFEAAKKFAKEYGYL